MAGAAAVNSGNDRSGIGDRAEPTLNLYLSLFPNPAPVAVPSYKGHDLVVPHLHWLFGVWVGLLAHEPVFWIPEPGLLECLRPYGFGQHSIAEDAAVDCHPMHLFATVLMARAVFDQGNYMEPGLVERFEKST